MRTTYVAGLAATVALLAGCGGGSDDTASTAPRPPLTCTSDEGLTFVTERDTCNEAFSRGQVFAADLELATQANTPAAESVVAMTCHQIQGTEPTTYEIPAIAELAKKLDSSGVCPGVLEMLVLATPASATTAPGDALMTTAGWTLVGVVDGDTVDVISAVEGQRRIDIIGINAPEPGQCMSEEATNALRLLVADKELVLVPDKTQANAEGNNVRFIEQVDGVDLGGALIDLGLALAEPVEPDISRGGNYAQRMVNAQTAAVGLWVPGACPPPATTIPSSVPPTTPAPPTT